MNINGYKIEPNANLSLADLHGANLHGSNLHGANLNLANLHGADLTEANLHGAKLNLANLHGANLHGSNLHGANLNLANLHGANLHGSNLHGAKLYGSNLTGSDLTDANLHGAYLSGADLTGARGLELTEITPQGSLVVWKKCREGVVKLRIPEDARRSNGAGRKCRAEFADVLELPDGLDVAYSIHAPGFAYRVGQRVTCDTWCEDRWVECGGGIHFYLTRKEAEMN